jgi:dipeptidase E
MRLLLGSGGFRAQERIQFLTGQMRTFFGSIRRLLFIPYALQDHDGYVRALIEKGINAGYELDGIHSQAKPQAAVKEAEAIFIGGGNTFRLLNELYCLDLLNVIRARVRAGIP